MNADVEVILKSIYHLVNELRNSLISSGDSRGHCLMFSHALQNRIDRALLLPCCLHIGSFNGMPHAWVSIWIGDEVWWIDGTADQFGDYEVPIIIKAFTMDEYYP